MPNIITHKIFAEEAYATLKGQGIKEIIAKNEPLFYIGSNGPDFLFFYHALPWDAYKSHYLNHLGSRMHMTHSNDFYAKAIACIRQQSDPKVRENMLIYLLGHLCHWALDKTTHPYIFYRTGNGKGSSASAHHRFESMIDTMMLRTYKGVDISEYQSYAICSFDDAMLKAIARMYVPIAKAIYHTDVKVHDLREALISWKRIQRLLYDPSNIKFRVAQQVESMLHMPWAISGNIVKRKSDERYDVMNLQHKGWLHPCDHHIVYHTSFLDLFQEALETACDVMMKAYECIVYDRDVSSLCKVIDNAAYTTGLSEPCTMKYFDPIYNT